MMKTAEQWIDENSSSGSLDGVVGLPQQCLDMIRAIQMDALRFAFENRDNPQFVEAMADNIALRKAIQSTKPADHAR